MYYWCTFSIPRWNSVFTRMCIERQSAQGPRYLERLTSKGIFVCNRIIIRVRVTVQSLRVRECSPSVFGETDFPEDGVLRQELSSRRLIVSAFSKARTTPASVSTNCWSARLDARNARHMACSGCSPLNLATVAERISQLYRRFAVSRRRQIASSLALSKWRLTAGREWNDLLNGHSWTRKPCRAFTSHQGAH